jgi:amino acid permease
MSEIGEKEDYYNVSTEKDVLSKPTWQERIIGNEHEKPKKALRSRHITFIALGGTIGTGIFLAIGENVALAGPGGALITYGVVGIFVFAVVVCLCEMAAYIPNSGAFANYATRFVDDSFGFALGINYYLQWAFSIPSELTSAAIIIQFWLPNIQGWVWAIVIIVPLFLLQLIHVRVYGELEYWEAIIKVIVIVLFIIVGLLYDWGAIPTASVPSPGLNNYRNGQAVIGGFQAFFQGVVYAFYSYGGTELVALTSGETAKPWRYIPRAAKTTLLRIFLFMFMTCLVVGLCVNENSPTLLNAYYYSDVTASPVTTVFEAAGFGAAKHVINAVLLTAVLSATNSCFYASSRMLMSMAHSGHMFKVFGWVNNRGVPVAALLMTLLISCLVFLTTIWGEGVVFTWFLNITGASSLLTWMSIGFISLRFRLAMKAQGVPLSDLPFKQYLFPAIPILVVVLGTFLLAGMGYGSIEEQPFSWKNPFGTYLGVGVFFLSYIGWKVTHWKTDKFINLREADLTTGVVWPKGHGREFLENDKEETKQRILANRSSMYGQIRYRWYQVFNMF